MCSDWDVNVGKFGSICRAHILQEFQVLWLKWWQLWDASLAVRAYGSMEMWEVRRGCLNSLQEDPSVLSTNTSILDFSANKCLCRDHL